MKKILILGAGMVAGPIIKFLLEKGYYVTVASNTTQRAEELINKAPKGVAISWNAEDLKTLDRLIGEHDITVSLLPYAFHVEVAKRCITLKKKYGDHFVCET